MTVADWAEIEEEHRQGRKVKANPAAEPQGVFFA